MPSSGKRRCSALRSRSRWRCCRAPAIRWRSRNHNIPAGCLALKSPAASGCASSASSSADIPRISNGHACGIDYPIELGGLSGGIDVKPAVKLNCEVTEAFAQVGEDTSWRHRRAIAIWSGVKTIKPLGGYSCRTMNSRRGNPMSEHAHGNAIDVGKFVLKNGKEIDVRKQGFFAFREKGLLKAVRTDSCKYFNTVLGPGSDPSAQGSFPLRPAERARPVIVTVIEHPSASRLS